MSEDLSFVLHMLFVVLMCKQNTTGYTGFLFWLEYSLAQSYIPTTMQASTQHNAAILKTHKNKAKPLSGHFLRSGNGEGEAGWGRSKIKRLDL